MSNIFSGTAIFNHTLKNEIIKISMSTDNINNSLVKNEVDLSQIKENLEVISRSAEYLMKMVKRIQDFSKEITLQETVNYIPDILKTG
ncbi:hypothetical protein [Pseudobacteroides cellulosolvens]|uniref:hypothetical protein n=1 Tax=Pseudobacteroides cellulosolvens TaxID=35825 RepID=UPI00128F095B|nr:hypothetical protein [Pseudobacteroides cellulosolvens]